MSPQASGVLAEKPRPSAASASTARPGPMPGKQAKPVERLADAALPAAPPAPAKSTVPPPAPPGAKPASPTTPAQVSALQVTYGNAAVARAAVGGEISATPKPAPAIAAAPGLASDSMGTPAAVATPVVLPPASEKTPAIVSGTSAPALAAAVPSVAPEPAAARAATTPAATLSEPAAPATAAGAPAKSGPPQHAIFTATSKAGVAEATPKAPELLATGKAPATPKAEVTVSRVGADGKGQARGEEGTEKVSRPPAREAIAPVVNAIRHRAAGARKHSPAGVPVASAQAAAIIPVTEQKRTAAMQTVANLDAAKTEQVKRNEFKAKLKEAIARTMKQPTTESEAEKVMKSGAKDASNALQGQLATERDAAAGPLKSAASTDVQPSSQPQPPKTNLVPEPVGAAPAPVTAAPVVPGPLPPEQLDYSSDRAPTDQAMAESGVTKEQLEKGNEPEFKQTLSSRAEVEKHEAAVGGRYRKSETDIRDHAEHAAHAEIAHGLAGMHGARAAQIGKVVAQQHATKTKHAAEHQRITDTINGIKNKTQTDVEEILRSMESDAKQIFEAGLARAEKAYEDTFKEEKGGTWTWLTTWGSAWEDLIERSLGKAREKYLQEVDVAIDAVADLVDAKLQAAKQRVARGRKDVETFVTGLDDSVRKFGEEALKSVSTDFNAMGSEIDQHRDALVDKLAQQYKASYDRMSAMEEKLREENKSLWQRIYDATVGLIKKILAFKDMLLNVLAKAASAIGTIIAHPIDFLGNLIDAGKLGFSNFIDHIWEHLKQGFMEWLFGAVAETGIQLPKDFDLPGILSLVLQILGLTYANIRSRAVKILGEKVVKALETAAEIFKILITKGPAGLWEYIKEKIGDLKSMVIEKIKSFVMEKIIMAGVTWLIGLLNPASAFFKACKAIYDIIMFFVDHGKQILDLLNAIIDSITAIAKGQIAAAAAWVEKSLARTIPVIIGFLASLLGIGGISEKIKEIIEAIRKPINEAIDWVINKAVDLVKMVGGLLGFGKDEKKKEDAGSFSGQVGKKMSWAAKGREHSMWIVTNGAETMVMVASETKTVSDQLREYEAEAAKLKEEQKKSVLAKIAGARAEGAKLDAKSHELALEVKKPQPNAAKENEEEKGVETEESTLVEILKEIQEALGLTGDFGTEKNPIPLDWPKRGLAAYPVIYVGPETGPDGARIDQDWMRGGDTKKIKESLTSPSDSDALKKWEAKGEPILSFKPDEETKLPDGTPVGVAPRWRVQAGMKIAMTKSEGTGGGGKINKAFAPYGFRAGKEGKDGDHIVERQIGGEDEIANLWPLDASENRGAGSTLKSKSFKNPAGGEVSMDDLKKKANSSNPVWFQIVSTK